MGGHRFEATNFRTLRVRWLYRAFRSRNVATKIRIIQAVPTVVFSEMAKFMPRWRKS